MALIKCPECGKEISDKASACIHCGYPILTVEVNPPINRNIRNHQIKPIVLVLFIVAVMGILAWFFFRNNSEHPIDKDESNALFELAPYLEYLGDYIEGTTLHISEEELRSMSNVTIADIDGAVTYKVSSFGKAFNIAGKMIWESNSQSYSIEEFETVKETILDYYNVEVNDSQIIETTELKCKNDEYVVDCSLNEAGTITIIWTYNTDNYNKFQVAGYAAVNYLKDSLKNPDSLQVHNVSYAQYAYCSECEDAIGIRIDYSAQNGLGGFNREYYYAFINPNGYTIVETFLSPETMLDSVDYISVSIDDVDSMRTHNNSDMRTVLIALQTVEYPNLANIMDSKLMSFLTYLDTPYSESGFTTNQSTNADGSRYRLDDALFLGEMCDIDVWYSDYRENGVASSIQIGSPVDSLSLEEINELLSEGLDTTPYHVSDNAIYIYVPDTNFEIHVFKFHEDLDADIMILYRSEE